MSWRGFGETVPGYKIPVLNEREVRASAGILYFFMFLSLMLIIFRENFLLIKFMVTYFLLDFIIRMFINPKYAPSLILGRIIVSRQNPEYVGAIQKKFAWGIGLGMAVIMFVMLVLLNSINIIFTGVMCLICLIFLFFESVFGICLGCAVYGWVYRDKAQYCPGEVCDMKTKQEIQKVSLAQYGVVAGFALFVIASVYLLSDSYRVPPMELMEKFQTASNLIETQP